MNAEPRPVHLGHVLPPGLSQTDDDFQPGVDVAGGFDQAEGEAKQLVLVEVQHVSRSWRQR